LKSATVIRVTIARYFGIDSNSEERVEQAKESIEGRRAPR
jgi:hypothetical protein